jgi:hypothetical protein
MDMKKNALIFLVLIIILALFLPSSPITLQSFAHPIGIVGYVKDRFGEPQHALVTVKGQTFETDRSGRYIATTTAGDGEKITITTTGGGTTLIVDLSEPTQWANITVDAIELKASFSFSPSSPRPNQTVRFIDSSKGHIIRWLWTFSDSPQGIIPDRNPTHMYEAEGTYTVTLTVVDDIGTTQSATRKVNVRIPPPPPIPPKRFKLRIRTSLPNCFISICEAFWEGLKPQGDVCEIDDTGDEGYIEYELVEGEYALSVGKPGFTYKTMIVKLDSDKEINIDIESGEHEVIEKMDYSLIVIAVAITAFVLVGIVYYRRKK